MVRTRPVFAQTVTYAILSQLEIRGKTLTQFKEFEQLQYLVLYA